VARWSIAGGLALASGSGASAQGLLQSQRIASGFTMPLFAVSPPGDRSRLFIVEQRGSAGVATRADIKVLNLGSNTVNSTPFFSTASAGVSVNTGFEQGLIGLAFDPNYATNRRFYVYYTTTIGGNGHGIIARYTTSASDPNVTDYAAGSLTIIDNADAYPSHNGGWLAFGPDGYFYVAIGDDTLFGDFDGNAQSLGNLNGKISRIDVRNSSVQAPYAIPSDNPFVGTSGARGEIWHYGLRNPYRDSFDRLTGDLYIGDVGQDTWEEVDVAPAGSKGLNFGWRCFEGNSVFSTTTGPNSGDQACPADGSGLRFPVTTFNHDQACCVIGGYVYRGGAMPWLRGTYFFSDLCGAFIRSFRYQGALDPVILDWTSDLTPSGGLQIDQVVSFGEDAAGELYIVDQGGGEIYKILPRCATNCDGSTVSPRLNLSDFVCFLSEFRNMANQSAAVQIGSIANCDGSTTAPVLTAADFTCFISKFAGGCP
jgi:glucose/arabinose dehydrogenase